MSFSSDTKNELSLSVSKARHCQIAELAAIFSLCGKVVINQNGKIFIKIHTENLAVARKYFTLLKKSFNIESDVSVKRNIFLKKSKIYSVIVTNGEDCRKFLQAIRLMNGSGELAESDAMHIYALTQSICCKRAFLRGSFLTAGSISDPEKTYHFEIACADQVKAEQLQAMMQFFDVDAKIILRKHQHVVYVKDGAQIVDMLNIMEAPTSLMTLENIRIAKEIRNSVNRQVNCEMANINKTVSAAAKQVEDIMFIKQSIGFGDLSDGLKEIANLRIENPEASLQELGRMLSSPVGKSGVNHRLRKLSQIADELRENM